MQFMKFLRWCSGDAVHLLFKYRPDGPYTMIDPARASVEPRTPVDYLPYNGFSPNDCFHSE